jgi:hypothetical protein
MKAQKILLSLVSLLLFSHIKAQIRYFTFAGLHHVKEIQEKKLDTTKYSINLSLGLPTGIGIEATYRVNNRYNLRYSFHNADLSITDYKFTFGSSGSTSNSSNQALLFDVDARLSHFDLNVDYYFFRKIRAFVGIGYYPINNVLIEGELADFIQYNDLKLNTTDLGKGSIRLGFSSHIVPNVGVGFERNILNSRFKILLDIGAQYRGDYRFKINVTEGALLKKNEENAAILERNFNSKWIQKIWPMLQMKFGCSF